MGPALPTTAATGTSMPSAAASASQLPLAPAWMIAISSMATATTIANPSSSRYFPIHQPAPRSGLVELASMAPICSRNHLAPSVNQLVTPCMSELLATWATDVATRPGVGRQPSRPAGPPGQEIALEGAALAVPLHSIVVVSTVAATSRRAACRRRGLPERDIGERLETLGRGDKLRRWAVVERAVQAALVPPLHPRQGGQLDLAGSSPRAAGADQLGLVQPVDRLGQRVVVAIAS